MRTRLSASAAAYLRSEAMYLRAHSPKAAQTFLHAIRDARRNLQRFPDMGNEWRRLPIPGARTVVVGDYLLDYIVSETVIEIVSVRHGRQRPLVQEEDDDLGDELAPEHDEA